MVLEGKVDFVTTTTVGTVPSCLIVLEDNAWTGAVLVGRTSAVVNVVTPVLPVFFGKIVLLVFCRLLVISVVAVVDGPGFSELWGEG